MSRMKITERSLAALALPEGKAQAIYRDSELTGFCVIVGKSSKTFAVRVGKGRARLTITIGRVGAIREDGHPWTATLARRRAQELLGKVAAGEIGGQAPEPQPAPAKQWPTLAEGLELHVANMRKGRRSEHSIRSIQGEVRKHLAAWLDRPIVELTALELDAVCTNLTGAARPRAGSVNPPGAAGSNRLLRHVSAIWTSTRKLHGLPGMNPAEGVTPHALLPKQERVIDLAAWYATVQTLSPVRRDLQLMTLFTGLRSDSVRHLRWTEVDEVRRLLQIERAKGDKPYTIPLVETHLDILRRRRYENPIDFDPYGGDHGWIFPSVTARWPRRVIPVAESKEMRWNEQTQRKEKILPGLHPLRRTYNSVAREIGIPLEDREALMNHNGQGVNLRVYTVPLRWDYLAECQARIEAALWERIGQVDKKASGAVQSKKSRAHLRAIDGGKTE
jgi:integrase